MTKHRAHCQCGRLSIEANADPDFVIACNCKACQRRTGAAFGTALYFRKSVLTLSGEAKGWSRKAESGREVETFFCPECGTSLYWTLEFRPDHMGVAYGAFETPVPDPDRAIWLKEKHGWVSFPDNWLMLETGSTS